MGSLWEVSYSVRRNLVVDAGFNRGLTSTSTQWEGFAGFTYLLPHRLWKAKDHAGSKKISRDFSYNFLVASRASSDVIQAFAALVRAEIEDERVDLLRAALTFARIEDPQLDIEHYAHRVEELARRVAAKIQDPDDPAR